MTNTKDEVDQPNVKRVNGYTINGHNVPSAGERNAWEGPGPAAFDFRSDTVTSPTTSMLAATQSCTLLDDVFAEDPTTISLERFIADLTGMEAALFMTSGTMGNQLSIRSALNGPPHSVLADSRSHVIAWEAGGLASTSLAMPIPVMPSNGHHLSLSDVQKHACLSDDTHFAPTRLISLENTLGGTILPLSVCRSISHWSRSLPPEQRIWLHLDGARLWEAVAAGAGTLKEYCECFDSVTMCFSKGLGAPIGSVIAGNKKFITKARHLRKMMGGGLRQSGVVTASARTAVEETFLGGKLAATHAQAKEVQRMWESRGGRIEHPVETNMVWLDLDSAGISRERFVEEGVKEGLKLLGGRVVVHYQICAEAVEALGRVMDRVLVDGRGERWEVMKGEKRQARENMKVEVE
ncbi:hypothetical protein ACLMJK_002720 [Lecanora helva]